MDPKEEKASYLEPLARTNIPLQGEEAFRSRFAKMAAPLQQKVGAVVVFLPSEGVVVDVGCADGPITEALAELCPGNTFVGIDNEPSAVELANYRSQKPNLSFRLADASEPIFEKESVNGIVLCSTAHELATYMKGGINGLWTVLDRGIDALKDGGRVVIRDFVVPRNGLEEITLLVPNNDGELTGEAKDLSTGAMLKKFLLEFKSSFYPAGQIPFRNLEENEATTSVRIALRDAAEFVLKKDYRQNWNHEVTEQFLHFTQEEIVREFLERGLRILLAREIHNPWIRKHSFEGKVIIKNDSDNDSELPPTNFLIAGEKTEKGILLQEVSHTEIERPEWNSIQFFRNSETQEIWELACRKHDRVHLLPWYLDEAGGISVLVCDSYPRPIVNAKCDSPNLDRSFTSGYLMELLYEVSGRHIEEKDVFRKFLKERGLKSCSTSNSSRHLTSPVDLAEKITMVSGEIFPPTELGPEAKGAKNEWSERGGVRSLSAQQVLRSTQMGAISEPEIERAVYRLLVDQGLSVGPWIGAEINLTEIDIFEKTPASQLGTSYQNKKIFEKCKEDRIPEYQGVLTGDFQEIDKCKKILAREKLEYISPKKLSNNKILVVPLRRGENGEVYVGLERRALPSTQEVFNETYSFSLPEYRLDNNVNDVEMGCKEVRKRLRDEFSLEAERFIPLGEKYWSSPSISPEAMYPFAVEVTEGTRGLYWISLSELLKRHSQIKNGHTLTGIFRAGHATGVLKSD